MQDPNQPDYPPQYEEKQGDYQQQQQPPPPAQHQGVTVVQPAPTTNVTIVQQAGPVRPSSYLALAIVVTICCNLVFGIIAIIFSVLSTSSADEGDIESARTKGKISLAMSLVGMFVTIIVVIIIIVYFVAIVGSVAQQVNNYSNGRS